MFFSCPGFPGLCQGLMVCVPFWAENHKSSSVMLFQILFYSCFSLSALWPSHWPRLRAPVCSLSIPPSDLLGGILSFIFKSAFAGLWSQLLWPKLTCFPSLCKVRCSFCHFAFSTLPFSDSLDITFIYSSCEFSYSLEDLTVSFKEHNICLYLKQACLIAYSDWDVSPSLASIGSRRNLISVPLFSSDPDPTESTTSGFFGFCFHSGL